MSLFPAPELQALVDTVHEPILVLDPDCRVLLASAPFYVGFRLSSDEVDGRLLFELGEGWDHPELRQLLGTVASAHEVVEGFELEHAFGPVGRRCLRLNVRPLRVDEQRIRGYLVAIHDMTAERMAADPSGSPLGIVTDNDSDLVTLHRLDGAPRYVSPSVRAITGYTQEELRETGLLPLIHPDDVLEFTEFFQRASQVGRSSGLAYRVRRKSGQYMYLGSTARPVRSPDGATTEVQLVSRDVTQRKRTEEALRWLSRQTKLILDSAGEGIFGLDLGGTITFINPAAAAMLGYTEGQLIGREHHALFHHTREDDTPYPLEECPIQATLREGAVRRVDGEVFCGSDGEPFPVEYASTPALDGEKIVGAVVTFRDITVRRVAEANLRRAEWLAGIGQTVLTLRHEINNPLTSMLADAALLEMEGNSPVEEREMVGSIVRQARRIRDVVHRLSERKDTPSLRQVGDSRMIDLSDSSPE